jgi:hypothetical protein
MRLLFFIIANALLFIRPSEFVAGLHAVELYRYAILACLVISLPVVLEQFLRRFAGVPPIAGCVLGLFPAIVLSNAIGGNADMLLANGIEFFKILVYFLLLLALITSTAHLRRFLFWFSVFTACLALVAVLRFHADLALPQPTEQTEPDAAPKPHGTFVVSHVRDRETGAQIAVQRMCGTGIFNDPNDLATVLVCALPLCLYWFTDPSRRPYRPLWMGAMLLCGYALLMTQSRGGLIALLAGLLAFLHVRFGGRQTFMLGMVALPGLLLLFAGRMTTVSTSEGTAQSRIQLWGEYLRYFQTAPLFGIGMGNHGVVSRHVAHNSFIHCYTELGLGGGTLLVGAFYFALRGLYRLRPSRDLESAPALDPELRRLYPYLLAMVSAYFVGSSFLTLSYVVPTYMVLALATVYLRLHAREESVLALDWNRLILPRLAGVSFAFLCASYTFVKLFAK